MDESKKTVRPSEAGQTIDELTERYQKLNERKIQAKTNLDNAKEQLRKLKKRAKDEYGTDDLEELKAKLKKLRDDNEKKRSEYEDSLNAIESQLAEVEKKHGPLGEIEISDGDK